VPVGQGYL